MGFIIQIDYACLAQPDQGICHWWISPGTSSHCPSGHQWSWPRPPPSHSSWCPAGPGSVPRPRQRRWSCWSPPPPDRVQGRWGLWPAVVILLQGPCCPPHCLRNTVTEWPVNTKTSFSFHFLKMVSKNLQLYLDHATALRNTSYYVHHEKIFFFATLPWNYLISIFFIWLFAYIL